MTGTVADLDVAIDAFRAHYMKASPKFRKDAAQYVYLGTIRGGSAERSTLTTWVGACSSSNKRCRPSGKFRLASYWAWSGKVLLAASRSAGAFTTIWLRSTVAFAMTSGVARGDRLGGR
jgi:hypothetical protein